MSLLLQLKQRVVRDLYWACFSEPLMNSGCDTANFKVVNQCFPHLEQWFLALDAAPTPLLKHISLQKSTRIGLYFEMLWEYYLRYAGVAELLAKNRQVRKGKQTIGEYDFVYYCYRRQCHIHLETAVKFYMGVPGYCGDNIAGLEQRKSWLGPACKDRLDIKYDALLQRQLELSKTKEGSESLVQLDVTDVRRELALKGILFYPYDVIEAPAPVDNSVSHGRGIWLHQDQLLQLCSDIAAIDEIKWVILERRHWCSPMQTDSLECLLDDDQLMLWMESYFADSYSMPIQIASMIQGQLWQESQRYFVVPNGWSDRLSLP